MNHDTVPHAAHDLPPVPAEKLTAPFRRFLALSSAGGVLLLICTVIALLWANSGFADAYHYIFHDLHLEVHVGDYHVGHGLAHWINDALMAVFFLVVGLEIKREMLVGELASPRKAALPIFAALGGMIAPAIIYATINWGQPTLHGWGVPMATDIAFALGILMLMGARAPLPLKVFLVSLATIGLHIRRRDALERKARAESAAEGAAEAEARNHGADPRPFARTVFDKGLPAQGHAAEGTGQPRVRRAGSGPQ